MDVLVILVGMELIVIQVIILFLFLFLILFKKNSPVCPSDRYGPDCSYQCSCPTCNRFTGVCNCVGTECYQGIYFYKLN